MEVFTCWIGEQEKEIRNIKTKTTVQDVILALLREHLQSLLIGELPSNACPDNLSFLIKRLWREFSLYDESSRGIFAIPYRQSIFRIHPASPDSVFRLRMNDSEFEWNESRTQNDEIELTKAILKQAERISDQNRIIKQIDRDIIHNQTIGFNLGDVVGIEELLEISDNLVELQKGVQLAEHKMNQLQNEIDHQVAIAPPCGEKIIPIDQSRSSWSSSSHASTSSTNRNSLNASLFSSFTSSSSSLNPFSTIHTNESFSKSYQSSSSISNLTSNDFILKPKSEYCTLPNMTKIHERPASKHAPLKRRDVEPPAIAPPGGHRFEQINILRRSVSEMHLVKEKRFSQKGYDKNDTDSDTGFSSLDSFDGDAAKCETLV